MSQKTHSMEDTNSNKASTSMEQHNQPQSSSSSLLSRCLLLSDTTRDESPAHLQELFKNYELSNLSKAEILFHLIYTIAMESGFAEHSSYQKCESELYARYPFPIFFDARNVLTLAKHKPTFMRDDRRLKFSMKLKSIVIDPTMICDDDHYNDSLIFNLSGIATGDLMIITLTPMREAHLNQQSYSQLPSTSTSPPPPPQPQPAAPSSASAADICPSRSVSLTIPRYILGTISRQEDDTTRPLHRYLSKMNELSYQLRESIFHPVQNDYLSFLEVDLYPSLLGLPDELYDNIFRYLSYNQLRILANVSTQLNQLVCKSKHYRRQPTTSTTTTTSGQSRLSFLSPSRSTNSFRFRWETLY